MTVSLTEPPVEGRLDPREVIARLQFFVEHAPAALAMFDREMRYLYVSQRWRSDYHLGQRELIGVSHYEVFPEIGDEWKAIHRRALAGEVVRAERDRFMRADGSLQWLRWEVRPWCDTQGQLGGIVIFTEDVTELARAAEEAQELASWLQLSLAAAGAGAWRYDRRTQGPLWSEELWSLFGLHREGAAPTREQFRELIVPEDRERAEHVMYEPAAVGIESSHEFRVRRPDGCVRDFLARARSMHASARDLAYAGIVMDITLHRQAEAREHNARSEMRYRQLLDAAPDAMIVFDEAGRVELVNHQAERMFGYQRAELVGQPLELLLPERLRPELMRFFSAAVAEPMSEGRELTVRTRDGSELPVEVRVSPLWTDQGKLVSAAVRDISERKRLQLATELTAQRMTSAIESMEHAFAIYDAEDRLVQCNSLFLQLIAPYVDGPVIGMRFVDLVTATAPLIDIPDATSRAAFVAQRMELRQLGTSYESQTRDGRVLRIANRRTTEGGTVTTIADITEDKHRAEELSSAYRAAAAGSAAKTEFLSSMSHELRTPLNAVLGFAQLMRRDKREPLSARQSDRIDRILASGEHLLYLIDDVLDLSRIEAGGVPLRIAPVSVPQAIEEVLQTLEPLQQRIGLTVSVAPMAALPLVAADRARYRQILTNLITNALKYNRPGGSVQVSAKVLEQTSQVRVSVWDTGPGIPDADQPRLFEPFQRAGQETGPIEGTGIGLVIARRLARLMGGDVSFESRHGVGSCFWIDIPVQA